jgi:TRAP transporter TAXI family solute receptor
MKRFDLKKLMVCVAAFLGTMSLTQHALAEQRLRILTGTAGGIFEPLGKTLADIIGKNVPNTSATSEISKGSVVNIHTLNSRQADIIFAQADVVWEGYKGYGEFREKVPLRTLIVLCPNSLQVVATRQSGIRTIKDMIGKRVSTNSPGTAGEIWALRVLAANNIDPDKDLQRHRLNLVDSVAALKSGKIDAFISPAIVPTKIITELAKDPPAGGLQFIDTAHAVIPMLRKHGPVYTDGAIAANTYAGQTQTVKVADVWNMVLVRADMDDKLAYDMVKAFFENKDNVEAKPELAAMNKVLKQVSFKDQATNSPIPFHPGAAKYLKEKGVRIFR